jgi:translocation and assembly module TamB
MTHRAKVWTWAGSLLLGLLIVLAVVSIQVLKSSWFEGYVRSKIVSVAEESTGGRVELGSFQFDWRHLRATVQDFVLHGTETPPNAPLFEAKRIELRLKLLAGLKQAIDLEYLGVDHPAANVIVFPDGHTNIPEPKVAKQSNKTALQTVVDLAIHRFEISNGSAAFSQQSSRQSAEFSGHGENLQVQLAYRPAPAGYQGDVKIGSLQFKSGAGQPLSAAVDLPIEIASDSVELKNAGITTHDSQLRVTATISHIAQPIVDAHVIAHVSLAEVQKTTGLAMDACKKNTPCYGDADVEGRLDQQGIQVSKTSLQIGQTRLDASGTKSNLQFNAKLALDEIGRLFRVEAEPRGEVTATGSAQNLGSDHYTASANLRGAGVALSIGSTRLENISLAADAAADSQKLELRNFRVGALGGEIDGTGSLAEYSQLRINGQLRNLGIRNFERSGAPAVYDGAVNGKLEATGNLKMSGTTGIRAQAQLNIVPDLKGGSRGVPVSGTVQAAYDGAHETVQIAQGHLALPHSRLDLSGVLGNRITVDLSSTNLDDLYPALAMGSTNPPQAMPVTLHGGRVMMHAEVSGPLSSPNIAAHVDADRFSVAERAFDRLGVDVSASAENAAVANGVLIHQGLQGQFSGAVGLKQWSPENNSPVQLTLDVHNGDIADLLALAGSSGIPAMGTTDVSVRLNGTVGNPQGTAHFAAANGQVYQQPFDKADAQIELMDQLVRLASLDVTAQTAHLQANGTYSHPRESLATGQAQIQVSGTGIQLGQIAILNKQRPGMNGTAQLNANATLNIRQAGGTSEIALASVKGDLEARGLRDAKQNYGDLTAHADTSGSNVTFNVASNLAGSAIRVTGNSGLTKDYPTTADVSIQNLRIENALALAGESLPASGLLGVTGRVSGTIKDPSAELELNLTSAKLYGEAVDRLQSALQYSNRRIEVSSLRLAAPAGNLTLNGSFTHPENQYNAGKIELHAQGDSLQLAKIQNVQQQKPGVAGTLKVMADFAGEIRAGTTGPDISISKLDANVNASGISYNGHSYGGATLVAGSSGNSVTFKADSDFAGASIHGEGEAELQSGYPVKAKLTLANVRYSGLRGFLGDESLAPGFEGLLEANASISGPANRPDDLKGNLQITRLEVSSASAGGTSSAPVMALKNDGVMAFDYDRGSMRIQNAHLTGKSTDISIAGTTAFKGANPLNLTIKANTNLGLLQELSRDIRASGAITMDATLRGTFAQPLANGSVQLKDASFNMESIPNGISNANGTVALNGSGASIRGLTAESGGGKLTLSGFATLTGTTLRYTLNARADHVRTRYQGISVVNSAALTLSGTSQRSLLNGTVTVERVAYNPQSDIGSMLAELTQNQTPTSTDAVSALAAAMRLDVRLRTSPAVRFETTMTRALEANADLTLEGTLQHPGLVGTVNITKGDLVFFGNEYTVDRGTISFLDPGKIDPRLSVDLETTVESVTVTLGVTGPMNDLKLSYRSDPPLRFDEIVGLLASGKRPSSDPNIVASQAAPPQQSVAELGETALVSQAVASPLSSRLQRVFGVNQLRIDPTFSSGSALPQARVSLQQRIADTITFTYTQDLSQSNSELVRVEWAVSPKFSAIATRDENGIFGLDFFYKRQYR